MRRSKHSEDNSHGTAAPEAGRLHATMATDAVGITLRQRRRCKGGGAARRLRVGLKAGPGAAARLEAGNCEEVFVRLFQMCAVFSHQACADGSIFFRCQLSKAGLSEST